jgi:hypothetical protein
VAAVQSSAVKADPAAEQRWLLVYNCVHPGLANCLRLLAPNLSVDSVDFGRFRRHFAEYGPALAGYDRIVTSQHFLKNESVDFRAQGNVRGIPMVMFDAYHPDMGYVNGADGELIKGPLGGYQSKIVIAGYQKGLNARQIVALFNGRNYERFGYFDFWDGAKARLLGSFANTGCDMAGYFNAWSAHGAFMYTGNHPAIHVIADVARALLLADGITPLDVPWLPHDNLLNGPIFPVYAELAEALSIPGGYTFKLGGEFRCIDLLQYVEGSLATLRPHDPATLKVNAQHAPSFERVLASL